MKKAYAMEQQQVSVYSITAPAPIAEVSDEWYGTEGSITADEWIAQHPGTVEQSVNAEQ
jgi:hypothetical protein